jgi:hypothetical protein
MSEFFRIENHGPLVVSTNFWDLPVAQLGKVYVSLNAGAFRVLLPVTMEPALDDLKTARECVVSRGPWPEMGLPDAFEVLFDDGTSDPFALHLSPQSFDHVPTTENVGKEWVLSVWTRPRRGKPHKALERPCWYRIVPHVPWLKPREKQRTDD